MDLFKNLFRQFRKSNSVAPIKHLTSNSDTDSLEKHSMANLKPKEVARKTDDEEINKTGYLSNINDNKLTHETAPDKVITVEPTEQVNSNLMSNMQEIELKCTQVFKSEVTDNGSNKTFISHNCNDEFIELTDPIKLESDCGNNYNVGSEYNNVDENTFKGLNEFNDIINKVTNNNGSNEKTHNAVSNHSFDELIDELFEQINQEIPINNHKNDQEQFDSNEDRKQLPSVIEEAIVLDQSAENLTLNINNPVQFKIENDPLIKQTDDTIISISSDEETETIIKTEDTEKVNEMSLKSTQCFKSVEEYDSDCSGYHSSDFEFISESDAVLEGLIINNARKNQPLKTAEIVREDSSRVDQNVSQQNHIVPEGEGYLNLFRGVHNPVLPPAAMHLFENKSVRSLSCMLVEFDGIGFDMQMLRREVLEDGMDDEFKQDARECVKKILEMYPRENRKRRRRF